MTRQLASAVLAALLFTAQIVSSQTPPHPMSAPPPQAPSTPIPTPGAAPSLTPSQQDKEIVLAPTLLSYKQVKDNFGKRIADTHIAVQVSIENADVDRQFILQDLRADIDPNQCAYANNYYRRFDAARCEEMFNQYFLFPIAYAPVQQSSLLASASIGQVHNPRNFAFRLLEFSAQMGGALTGFNFVGRDGKAGLSVFNGTFLNSAKSAFPDLTLGQMTQLTQQAYKPNTVVNSKETGSYTIFIPTDKLFSKETWKLYKQDPGNASAEALRLRQLLQLVISVTAIGVHVKSDSPTPESKSAGGAPSPTRTPTPTSSPTSTPTPE